VRAVEYVKAVLDRGVLAGDGPVAHECERLLASITGAPKVFLTPSCTDALEMSAILLDLAPGDEVIVPSFTFTSTATAFALRGAQIVFVDSRPDTMNLDETQLEALVTERTRAIVTMHYGGVACEMDEIMRVAVDADIPVIEDNAHGLGALYRGRQLGTFGTMATQSFHETKNISCGEGGALILNDLNFLERAEIVREKGTNRTQFGRGAIDKYMWVDQGSSFLPSEITASVLLAQLEEFDRIQSRRRAIWERYFFELEMWADASDVDLPTVPEGCEQAFHLFYLLMPNIDARVKLQSRLADKGILAITHYVPLHSSPYGSVVGRGECSVATDVSGRLLRLPFYTDLDDEEQSSVIRAVTEP
jgi:dTDP-4-amino-4,6-dideoxygalactose transaminase